MIRQSIELWVCHGNSILLLQVAAGKKRPAFWQPITGGIKKGESVRCAALRELREETGIIADESSLSLIASDISVRISEKLSVNKALFTLQVDQSQVVTNPKEHVDHQWVHREDVIAHLYWESNKVTWSLVENARG